MRLVMKRKNQPVDITFVDNIRGICNARGIVVYISGELSLHNPKLMDYSILLTSSSLPCSYQSIKPIMWPSCLFDIKTWPRRKEAKTRFCAFICRNTVNFRTVFVQKLQRYKRVDCPGACLNNMEAIGKTWQDKIEFMSHYKFAITFENSIYPGYTTEKIYDALIAGCVPIYYGDPNITLRINPQAFINVSDFPSTEAAIDYIIKVDKDAQLYARYQNAEPYHQDSIMHQDTDENLALFCKNICMQALSVKPKNTYFSRLYRCFYVVATMARGLAAINRGRDSIAWNAAGFPLHRLLSHWRVWLVGIPRLLYPELLGYLKTILHFFGLHPVRLGKKLLSRLKTKL